MVLFFCSFMHRPAVKASPATHHSLPILPTSTNKPMIYGSSLQGPRMVRQRLRPFILSIVITLVFLGTMTVGDDPPTPPWRAPHRIAIIGSGNFGTAIARLVGQNVLQQPTEFQPEVRMWVYEEKVIIYDDGNRSTNHCAGLHHIHLLFPFSCP